MDPLTVKGQTFAIYALQKGWLDEIRTVEDGMILLRSQDALHGDWDVSTITLTSQSDPRVVHTVKLTSIAFWHRMLIPMSLNN
jgi:hypothetical protein